MTQIYFTVLTQVGEAKLANLAVTGRALKLTHFAVGDGGGADYAPTSEQLRSTTTLVNELYRGQISLLEQDPTLAAQYYMEGYIPIDEGPFTVREAGWFDEDGVMIFATRYPPVEKTIPSQGAQVDLPLGTYVSIHQVDDGKIQILVDPSKILATRQYVDTRLDYIPITTSISASSPRSYRFMAPAVLTLPVSGSTVRAIVDHAVSLAAGDCIVQAPEGETIATPKGNDRLARIRETGREYLFVRTNNQWRVS